MPKISVIIPCYNQGQYIDEAVESVLSQPYQDVEIIIVNDGSTHEFTKRILKNYDKPKTRVIHTDNKGLASARNTGIKQATGEYILPLDADDKIRPHYLKKASELLDNNPNVGVVYPYAQFFGEKDGVWEFPEFDPKRLLLHNFIVACSVYRKEIWEACGGYDPEMRIGYEDWEFWIRVMKKGWQFHLIREVMFDYRARSGSMVTACGTPENRRFLIRYICNKHRELYVENLDYVISEKDVSLLQANTYIKHLEKTLNQMYHFRDLKFVSICYKIRDRLLSGNRIRRFFAKIFSK
ncbi:glycosyltransferase family 2 protein [Desulfonema magnum]|uniref:Glycosyl transferase, family II n=1 Tax=Desulfonema magnum TaxID=45655 RepID=A0A975BFX4_9BACT|nr:glycosyltransferase family A protein [Desulfonema magnum]QTA84459.1 Glycosyl transferase, family II [Desulfonema magnum]